MRGEPITAVGKNAVLTLKRSICGPLALSLTQADGREQQKVIDALEGDQDLILVGYSRSPQRTGEIERVTVDPTIWA
jgi:hypothetical protein